jgi:hypothetical protein
MREPATASSTRRDDTSSGQTAQRATFFSHAHWRFNVRRFCDVTIVPRFDSCLNDAQ